MAENNALKPGKLTSIHITSQSRDAVESAIDFSKEHFEGTWEEHISYKKGRIPKWHAEFEGSESGQDEPDEKTEQKNSKQV